MKINDAHPFIIILGTDSFAQDIYKKISEQGVYQPVICSYIKPPFEVNNHIRLEPSEELEIISSSVGANTPAAVLNRTDFFITLHAQLTELYNLPGPRPDSIKFFRNKANLHQLLLDEDLSQYRPHTTICTLKDLRNYLKTASFPLMIKPFVGVKSRGVIKITGSTDIDLVIEILKNHFQTSKSASHFEEELILVEDYIDGNQVTATSWIDKKGIVHTIALTDVITAKDEGYGHTQLLYRTTPSLVAEYYRVEIEYLLQKLANVTNLRSTFIHPEFIISNDQLFLIEINVRMGGFRHEISRLALGLDLNQIALDLALNDSKQYVPKFVKSATGAEIWESKSGVIQQFEIPNHTAIQSLEKYFDVGDEYIAPPQNNKSLAQFYVCSEKDSLSVARDIRAHTKLIIE